MELQRDGHKRVMSVAVLTRFLRPRVPPSGANNHIVTPVVNSGRHESQPHAAGC
jgi:hypothetical protein